MNSFSVLVCCLFLYRLSVEGSKKKFRAAEEYARREKTILSSAKQTLVLTKESTQFAFESSMSSDISLLNTDTNKKLFIATTSISTDKVLSKHHQLRAALRLLPQTLRTILMGLQIFSRVTGGLVLLRLEGR